METQEISADFNTGIIPDDQLQLIKKDLKGFATDMLNSSFTFSMPSRHPIQVAAIIGENEKAKVEFYTDKLESIYKRAGTRPIISIATIGRYQQGKTTTTAGLTGNWGHIEGNGICEKTNGVYADGPYELQYFYERFCIEPPADLFFADNENLTPVIFFFDIEGYGGKLHGIVNDVNNNAFVNLCTPFLCMSSVFLFMADKNPDIDEIDKIINTMKISSLTIQSSTEGNGALSLIIGVKNVVLLKFNEPVTKENINKAIQKSQKEQLTNWYGKERFESKGIKTIYAPMISPANNEGYLLTFENLAKEMIHAIEIAAQGNYMRGIKESLSLFEYIVNNFNKPSFEHDIKDRIAQEHENTLGTIAFGAMNKSIMELKPSIESYFENIEKNTENEISIDEILNYFNPIALESINCKLYTVRDSQEVCKYIDQFKYVVSNVVRRRYDSYQRRRNEQFIINNEKQQRIMYEKQLNQDESKSTEAQKIIAENMIIDKLHAIVSRSFLDLEQNEIEILRGKLFDLPFYKESYNNKNGIVNDIKKSIEEKLSISFDQLIEKAVCNIKNENPQLNSIFDEVINEKKNTIKEKNLIKDIVNSNMKSIQKDVLNAYSEAKDNLTETKHEVKREGNGLKVRVSERIIYSSPDGKIQEEDWKVVRSEWKTFDDIVEGAGKIISFVANIAKTIVSPLTSLFELFTEPKTPESKQK